MPNLFKQITYFEAEIPFFVKMKRCFLKNLDKEEASDAEKKLKIQDDIQFYCDLINQ